MNDFVEALREQTQLANERQQQEAEAARLRSEQKALRDKKAARCRAARHIEKIRIKCAQAANTGQDFAEVMQLNYDDFKHDTPFGTIYYALPAHLIGEAKLVYDHCVANFPQVDIVDWHDGVGRTGGYNLVVRWGETS